MMKRLRTVLDADRILVMENGKVGEFDSPQSLQTNPESLLSKLIISEKSMDSE